jgi:hypothetical protein
VTRASYIKSRVAAMRDDGSYGTEGAGRGGQIDIDGHAWVSGRRRAPAVVDW